MGEPISASISAVLALAGVFTSCVDCFNYVQIGRGFGGDFHSSQVRIRAVKLRFARWGKAVGLCIVNNEPDPNSVVFQASADDREELTELLDEKDSARYLKKAQPDEIAVYRPEEDLDKNGLNRKLQSLALRYQMKTSFVKRADWALYRKDKVEELVGRLTGCVNDIIELFPAQEQQSSLVTSEMEQIKDEGSLSELVKVINNEDRLLKEAAEVKLKTEFFHVFREGELVGGSAQLGDIYRAGEKHPEKGNLYDKFKISGGNFQLGNIYGDSNSGKEHDQKLAGSPASHLDYMDNDKFGK